MLIRKSIITVASLFLCAAVWASPSLSVGNATGSAGSKVDLALSFDPGGSQVSAAQFSLILPSGVSPVSVTAGPAATSAGKIITAKQQGNQWNVLIMGMNQTNLGQGMLATATVQLDSGASAGAVSVTLKNVVYSDPAGHSVKPGKIKRGSIQIKNSSKS